MASRSIFKLFRQGLMQENSMRAGASNWARPDVPLMVPYKHRRVISIFDVNMWFYCGVQPEYFINSNEAYLENALGGIKHFLLNFKWLAMSLVGGFIVTIGLYNGKMFNVYPDAPQTYTHTIHGKLQNERPMLKYKHFIGFKLTPESGVYHHDALAKTSILEKNEIWLENLSATNKQNQEAKNYIERVEREARQKVAKRNLKL